MICKICMLNYVLGDVQGMVKIEFLLLESFYLISLIYGREMNLKREQQAVLAPAHLDTCTVMMAKVNYGLRKSSYKSKTAFKKGKQVKFKTTPKASKVAAKASKVAKSISGDDDD